MLPPLFIERFNQLMGIKVGEIARDATGEFSRHSAEFAGRGHQSRSKLPALHHQNTIWIMKRRIGAALEEIRRLVEIYKLPHSDSLASELKALVEPLAAETWCKQSVDRYGLLADQQRIKYDNELLQQRGITLNQTNAEIDLLADGIRNRGQSAGVQPKELEQKFQILFSARQACIDFSEWAEQLKGDGGSVGILYVDIDNFKQLNERHTNTIIDETILPAAMHLIRKVAHLRGGAYRHGGEEFLVILPNCNPSELLSFGETLRSTFASTPFKVKENVELVTVSIGIALSPQNGLTYDEVLLRANEAEIEAKHSKNKCTLAISR